ncbi:MAG: hypothetical protein NC922_01125 [Candidatus Omnitrophica bacterium]|nr:hypothetical protein [Candidatus Omnitrophota bacterium]
MKKLLIISISLIIIFSGCFKKREITNLPLSPQEIEEAINYGRTKANLTFTEFTEKWTIDYGYEQGKGKVTLITPFLRIALLSKNATEKRQKIDMKVINLALKDIADKIVFKVTLYGDYPTFGRTAKFYLEYNNKKIQPLSAFMSPYSQFARDYTHISEGEVKFSNQGIPKTAKVKLFVVFIPYEKEKETTCSFEFDLSKYK